MPTLDFAVMKFSMKLKNLLDERGLDQQQLAIRMGVSQSKVSRWCTGLNLPDMREGLELAEYFGVSVYWLADDSKTWPYKRDEPARSAGVVNVPSNGGSNEADGAHKPIRKVPDAPSRRPRKR